MGALMFSFAWPWMALLLPLPFLLRRRLRPRPPSADGPEILFPHVERLEAAFGGARTASARSLSGFPVLLSLVWLCLVATLMQPQTTRQMTQIKTEGHDLMLAVDLSGSMKALDFATRDNRVTRLDVIKAVVGKFVLSRQGDRVGLILFGSQAYLHVPLTFDLGALGQMVDHLIVGEAGDSTAIGDAIGLAVKNLRDRPESSRVLILLTDGGDNSSTVPPVEAAKLAAQYGIRIYTIGIGSNGPVPIEDETGRVVMAQMDLDEGLLKNIAQITGGSYFRATDTRALSQVYARIDKLEKTPSEARSYVVRDPLYRYPLGAAMALLLVVSLLPFAGRGRYGN